MKKLVSLLLTLCVFISLCSTNVAYAKNNKNTASSTEAADQYGRLSIPDVGIDVALYNSNSQTVIDAADSACLYSTPGYSGMTIADHNYQGFSALNQVEPGTTATISLNNDSTIQLQCTETTTGTNTGHGLLDSDGNPAKGEHDFLTYTCIDNQGGIRICQWDIVDAENIDRQYNKGFNIDRQTDKEIASYATSNGSHAEKGNGNGNGNGHANGNANSQGNGNGHANGNANGQGNGNGHGNGKNK